MNVISHIYDRPLNVNNTDILEIYIHVGTERTHRNDALLLVFLLTHHHKDKPAGVAVLFNHKYMFDLFNQTMVKYKCGMLHTVSIASLYVMNDSGEIIHFHLVKLPLECFRQNRGFYVRNT